MVRSTRPSVWLSAVSFAALACVGQQAVAAENGLQRYSPGIGGSDMTAPLTPGLYLQVPLVHYHAKKLRGGDGSTATAATPITSRKLPVTVMRPRPGICTASMVRRSPPTSVQARPVTAPIWSSASARPKRSPICWNRPGAGLRQAQASGGGGGSAAAG